MPTLPLPILFCTGLSRTKQAYYAQGAMIHITLHINMVGPIHVVYFDQSHPLSTDCFALRGTSGFLAEIGYINSHKHS